MKKNILFMFIGMFIMAGIVVVADNLSASEIDYRDTKVDQALDTLYQRSTYTEYDGSTEVTPSAVQQTLSTNNKLLKSNITINAVPTFTPAASYTPSSTTQTLSTQGKMLTGDVVINPVSSIVPETYSNTVHSTTKASTTNVQLSLNKGLYVCEVVYNVAAHNGAPTEYYKDSSSYTITNNCSSTQEITSLAKVQYGANKNVDTYIGVAQIMSTFKCNLTSNKTLTVTISNTLPTNYQGVIATLVCTKYYNN